MIAFFTPVRRPMILTIGVMQFVVQLTRDDVCCVALSRHREDHRKNGRKPPPSGVRRNAAQHSSCIRRSFVREFKI
jgi:hypothetical protein